MIRAAIFDIDNTLIKGHSERIFIRYLREKGILSLLDLFRFLATFLLRFFTFRGLYLKKNKSYLRGKEPSVIGQEARKCFAERIIPRIYSGALEEIKKKRESGYVIILLSGSLDVLIEEFRVYCGADLAIGSRLEMVDGLLTGELEGIHPYGHGKALLIKELASRMDIDLQNSFAYSDHFSDVELLRLVGNPVAVNAHPGLRLYAWIFGWPVIEF